MKVAMHVDGVHFRGSERQSQLIARGLRARGHTVAVSCRGRGVVRDAFAGDGFATTGVRPRGDVDVASALAFAAWLRRERPDAVLLTSWVRLFAASLAARVAGAPRVVLRVGGTQWVPARGVSGWKYRRGLLRQVDVLMVNSPGLARRFREQVPELDPARIRVVLNAVEFTPAPAAPLRDEVGAAPGDRLLLAAGGLERRKGFDLLVDALAKVDDPRLRVVIAGSGPDEAALRARAAERGVGARVHLLGQRRDLPALMAAADAFVLSSRGDSMANVMLEAMAAGLPVLATAVPGSEDALAARGGRTAAGWIVPPRDEDALADGLRSLATALSSGEASARAAEARWRAEHWFTAERMVDGVEAVLRGDPGGESAEDASTDDAASIDVRPTTEEGR